MKLLYLAACGAALVSAQIVYAPKGQPAQYTAPHKPHTKLADLKAKHKGKKQWREVIVDDKHLHSEYLYLPPGTKHPKAMHPDTRAWWVVMEGEVRFDIEDTPPVTARKGSMVQVPFQTFFSYEVAGSAPALIFETNIAGAKYNSRVKGMWLHNNKPHVTYDEIAGKLETGEWKGTIRVVQDDRGTANFIYGYNSKLPPLDEKNKGHYHPEGAEYWLIMSGKIRYPIEKVGVVIAEEGDVVYVPPFTWHAPRWWGDGASCRLAMNGFPQITHLFEAH
jgi:mannose-6-phosphate isomerase-like protein (cupin superfamily)